MRSTLTPFYILKTTKTVRKIILDDVKLTIRIDFNNDDKEDISLSYDLNSLDLLIGTNEKIKGDKCLSSLLIFPSAPFNF